MDDQGGHGDGEPGGDDLRPCPVGHHQLEDPVLRLLVSRAPQLENDFHGNGDGGKISQNDPLRLGPRSFGSKLMDHDGLKVSHFQLKI